MTDDKRKTRKPAELAKAAPEEEPVLRVRRIHRRDLNRVWEFLKLVFRDVNRETVEYQRPRSKKRFSRCTKKKASSSSSSKSRATAAPTTSSAMPSAPSRSRAK